MHLPTSSRFYACGLLAFAALSSALRADSLTWDSSGLNPNAPVDGAGAWDTTSALWSNGSVDSIWNNAGNNTAVFGSNNGAAGTVTVGTITAGGITFNPATSGSYLLSGGTLTLGGSTPTITTNANAEIASAIAGTTGLTKEGSGVLTLSGTNTFTGGLKINAGTVSFSVKENLPSVGTTPIILNGGALRFTGTTYTAIGRPIELTAAGGVLDASGTTAGGYVAYSGLITFTGVGARNLTLTGSSTAGNTISAGVVDGSSGATSLVKEGSGLWQVRGVNKTYTGDTIIKAGTLRTYGDADNELSTSSRVFLNTGATLSLNANQTIVNLQDGASGGGTLTGAYKASITAEIRSGNFSGSIVDSSGSRLVAVSKTSSSVLRLRNASSTYSAGTTISGGTLLINNTSGTGLGVGNVTVTNATLGGNGYSALGTAASHTIGSGGVIAPGDSEINGGIGTLTLNGANSTGAILDMQAGSSFSFNLGAGDANDTLRFYTYAGASDFLRDSGGVVLNFSGALAGTYDLFRFYSNAGTTLTDVGFTQATSNFTLGSGLTGYNATWDYSTLGVISLTLTAVPEPSSAVLFGLGGLCAMVLWRRARYRASVRG